MANIFNAAEYLAKYPALADYGYNESNAWDHFVQYGAGELRTPNAELDGKVTAESVLAYANGNPELAEHFGITVPATELSAQQTADLVLHYVQYGNAEDRANKLVDFEGGDDTDGDLSELESALASYQDAAKDKAAVLEEAREVLELDEDEDVEAALSGAVEKAVTELSSVVEVDGEGIFDPEVFKNASAKGQAQIIKGAELELQGRVDIAQASVNSVKGLNGKANAFNSAVTAYEKAAKTAADNYTAFAKAQAAAVAQSNVQVNLEGANKADDNFKLKVTEGKGTPLEVFKVKDGKLVKGDGYAKAQKAIANFAELEAATQKVFGNIKALDDAKKKVLDSLVAVTLAEKSSYITKKVEEEGDGGSKVEVDVVVDWKEIADIKWKKESGGSITFEVFDKNGEKLATDDAEAVAKALGEAENALNFASIDTAGEIQVDDVTLVPSDYELIDDEAATEDVAPKATALVEAKANQAAFQEALAKYNEVKALVDANEAADDAIDAAVEALEALGYELADDTGSEGNDLFVFLEQAVTVYDFGTEGDDVFYFGGEFSFVVLEDGEDAVKDRVGDKDVLEIFAQQDGDNVVLYVETNEVGGNATNGADLIKVELVGVNVADLQFNDGFLTLGA